ncbi:aminotransferase class III-fold pyridoxal phosphate-dependent enzyme [Roseovarius aestuarii]|uniref:2,2-dialkylglycine decarboxylase n=1 Tax=Roseovarius aestuarii TaxID=475083 RepID=A0A1X7BLQ5_9RHOB|nr:aminotransferase class III-fold pyridoxal phosphate-dependent enzyme [Roseovarius aestuarii]SMC10556.1 2,2-dialkylglycine decarboxylase [Roseovarius aestuarii]
MSEHWQKILKDIWGITAGISPLDGEYDLNFMVEGTPGYVLKVMRTGCVAEFVDMQCRAIAHLASARANIPVPGVVQTIDGRLFAQAPDEAGQVRIVWLLEKAAGIPYARFRPHTPDLARQLGQHLGAMDKALARFAHPGLTRDFKWNLTQGGWIAAELDVVVDTARRGLLTDIVKEFTALKPALKALPQTAIHNDVNDYNILVTGRVSDVPRITGIIDFGDMCAGPRIYDLAIAGAYLALDHDDPETMLAALVAGYHAAYPLDPAEVDMIWPLLRMRLAVSLVISTQMAAQKPDDPYVVVSQAPAWRFLETHQINPGTIGPRLRAACGLSVTDAAPRIMAWLDAERGKFAPLIGEALDDAPMGSLSVEASTTPQNPFHITAKEAATAGAEYHRTAPVWLGYYCEPRLIYTESFFRLGPWKASDRRTVHIAVDVFAEAETQLYAPLAGTVEFAGYRDANLDYGGLVILRHETPQGDGFYTIYGHLAKASAEALQVGQGVAKGEAFARLGVPAENGHWSPHVHFQLALSLDGYGDNLPGVAAPDLLGLWTGLCPNPAALLNLPDAKTRYQPVNREDVLKERREHFGANLRLTYDQPVMLMRGWKHHLFDEWGRPYLDAYNNVPHVGHAHPRIQAVAADQLKRINSNTRYLHPAQTEFAEKILSKLPDPLSVCFFVNSGTEANELALRLARAHTGGKDMITPDHGYHGNTTGVIDISAYKFNAKGGVGQPDWVQLIEVADDYRGSFGRDDQDRAEKFAALTDTALDNITKCGGKLAGFIAETYPSVGGQIIPPKGYLAGVYRRIRAAGGVCIADEVQTGLGRLGEYYFGFEEQGVVPDIVVMGKPIGNGHPLGVLVTTHEIADSFAQGPEYFSTFGGSTLSCRIGKEVLDIVDDEGLMENARIMGGKLLAGLRDCEREFDVVGDVRGMGLFIGVELISDDNTRAPGTEIAAYVKNRMRDVRILLGSEGPHDNVLKIRPPLTIDEEGCEMILHSLKQVLQEVTIRQGMG